MPDVGSIDSHSNPWKRFRGLPIMMKAGRRASPLWKVQQAKARFSELLDRTLKEGPQTVTRHGRAVAVILPVEEYRRLRRRGKGLKALLAAAPLEGVKIVRSRDPGRSVKL